MTGTRIRGFIMTATLLSGIHSIAQVSIEGTVYDKSLNNPITEVNVFTSRGVHAVTDSLGHYRITAAQNDTLFFSYLGKQTNGFPVRDIHYTIGFDVSMDVVVRASLPAVLVTHNSYQQDSLENRKLWEKTFDYQKDAGVRSFRMMPMKGMHPGVGLDFDMFFNKSARKSNEVVQKWLISEENENYIDHRWNKRLVARITGLDSAQLRQFMTAYRPTKEYLQGFGTEYEFYQAIKEQGQWFLLAKADSIKQAQATDTSRKASN
ncbi:MAG: carboxypeptidase-like regulatory domain-containing protein [Ilumatobacteraceae bacterium]